MSSKNNKTLNRSLWNPMATEEMFKSFGLTFVGGRGNRLVDSSGREYLSGSAGLWNVSFGYSCRAVKEAISAQLDRLPYGSLFINSHEPAERLARSLAFATDNRLPFSFFTTGGAGGIEAAVKMARGYQSLIGSGCRKHIMVFPATSWHGTLLGSMQLTREFIDQARYGAADPLVVEAPCYHGDAQDRILTQLESVFEIHGPSLAAVVVEPVQASGGVRMYSKEFYLKLSELCSRFGVLIIADEVAAGFGRVGEFLSSDVVGLSPDIAVLSKGLTGGYLPLGAVMCSREVREAFEAAELPFLHGETQGGNPVACAAGLASMDLLLAPGFLDSVQQRGLELWNELKRLRNSQSVSDVRSVGLMACVDVRHPEGRALRPDEILAIVGSIRDCGVLVHPMVTASGIGLFPPLTISAQEIRQIVLAVEQGLGVWRDNL